MSSPTMVSTGRRAEDRAVRARRRAGGAAGPSGRPRRSDRFGLAVGLPPAGRGRRLDLHTVSSAIGGLIVPAASPIRDVAGLAGQRLGIAGSALDKSWLVLRLFARARLGLDLDALADKSFGAPPLLSEALAAGRLDAVLTYWPFAAKLEARGMRRLLSIGDALAALGIPADLPLTGYVVSARWANDNQTALEDSWARRDGQMRFLPLPMSNGTNCTAHRCRRSRRARQNCATPTGTDPAPLGRAEREAAARLYRLLAEIGGAALVGRSPSSLRGPSSTP